MTILHLKERVKKQDINRVTDTKGRDQNKVYRHCRHNGVGREVRVKEPMLAIDKPIPSPIITL